VFITECLAQDSILSVKKRVVYDRFRDWATAQGQWRPMTQTALGKQLKERGFPDGDGSDYWRGWTLQSKD
jgi:hypothetical protein